MKLKDKILGMAKSKIKTLVNTEVSFNDAINLLSEKSANENGIKSIKQYRKKENKYYLIFKIPSTTIGILKEIIKNPYEAIEKFGSMYQFCDMDGNVKYISDFDSSLALSRETVTLYDENRNKYGEVKEYLMSFGYPFLEKEVKKCRVDFGDSNLCKLKKYVSWGDLEFETLEGKIHIKCVDQKAKKYSIKNGNKIIAKVNELPTKFIDGLAEHYIIEYKNIEDEKIITLVVVALKILLDN